MCTYVTMLQKALRILGFTIKICYTYKNLHPVCVALKLIIIIIKSQNKNNNYIIKNHSDLKYELIFYTKIL